MIKKYDDFLNENMFDEIPSILKKVVKKLGDWSLVPKILKALKGTPEDLSDAFDYLSNVFGISGDKQGFINMIKTEIITERYTKWSKEDD